MAQKHVLTAGPSFDYIDQGANLGSPQEMAREGERRASMDGVGVGMPLVEAK